MQPLEVVAEAIDILERPDLYDLGRIQFKNALHKCHALAEFSRDINAISIPRDDVTYNNGHVIIPFNLFETPVRRLVTLETRSNIGHRLDFDFIPVQIGETGIRDYFGFTYRKTFTILGNVINLYGVSENFSSVHINYLTFPEITITDSEDLVTDSWILLSMPDLVVAALTNLLAKIIQAKDLIAVTNEEFILRAGMLLQNYGTEIVAPPTQRI